MKRLLLIPILSGMTGYLYAQAPADTTLNLQNVEVQGARFAGLSERQGMRYLNVAQNLSSVTNTTAEALRHIRRNIDAGSIFNVYVKAVADPLNLSLMRFTASAGNAAVATSATLKIIEATASTQNKL